MTSFKALNSSLGKNSEIISSFGIDFLDKFIFFTISYDALFQKELLILQLLSLNMNVCACHLSLKPS